MNEIDFNKPIANEVELLEELGLENRNNEAELLKQLGLENINCRVGLKGKSRQKDAYDIDITVKEQEILRKKRLFYHMERFNPLIHKQLDPRFNCDDEEDTDEDTEDSSLMIEPLQINESCIQREISRCHDNKISSVQLISIFKALLKNNSENTEKYVKLVKKMCNVVVDDNTEHKYLILKPEYHTSDTADDEKLATQIVIFEQNLINSFMTLTANDWVKYMEFYLKHIIKTVDQNIIPNPLKINNRHVARIGLTLPHLKKITEIDGNTKQNYHKYVCVWKDPKNQKNDIYTCIDYKILCRFKTFNDMVKTFHQK